MLPTAKSGSGAWALTFPISQLQSFPGCTVLESSRITQTHFSKTETHQEWQILSQKEADSRKTHT